MESCSARHKGANEGSTAPTQELRHFLPWRAAGNCASRRTSEVLALLQCSSGLPGKDQSAWGSAEDSSGSSSHLPPKAAVHPSPGKLHHTLQGALALKAQVVFITDSFPGKMPCHLQDFNVHREGKSYGTIFSQSGQHQVCVMI